MTTTKGNMEEIDLTFEYYQDLNKNSNLSNPQKIYIKVKYSSKLNIKSLDSKIKVIKKDFNIDITKIRLEDNIKKYLFNLKIKLINYINSFQDKKSVTIELLNYQIQNFYDNHFNTPLKTILKTYYNKNQVILDKNVKSAYNKFLTFLEENNLQHITVDKVNVNLMLHFEIHMLKKLKETTVNLYIKRFVSFINQFLKVEHYDNDSIDLTPKSNKKNARMYTGVYLNEEEIAILNDFRNKTNKTNYKKVIETFFIGYFSALRYSDIEQIGILFKENPEIIDCEDIIIYSEKTKKITNVKNNEFIKNYLKEHKVYSRKRFSEILKEILKELKINREINLKDGLIDNPINIKVPLYKLASSHIIRRSSITNCYLKTRDIYLCYQLAQHTEIETTVKYLDLEPKDKEEILKNYSENVSKLYKY